MRCYGRGGMDFRILGPLEVTAGDRLLALGGPRQRALLAVLLLHANEVVSTDRLIDALWGDSPPDTAHKALQGNVLALRKALEPDRKPDEAWGRLVTQPPGYLLRVEPRDLDLERFEELAAEGRAALQGGDPARAAVLLREALGLWRGPPLADVAFEAFAQAEVTRLEEARLAGLEERIEADLALGRDAELVGELESLVAREPLRERLRGQLMLCLYRCGRQADALACYRHGREALVEGLGIEPGPALRELEQRILRQDPSLECAAPTDRAVEVALPPLLHLADARPFVGRARELEQLRWRWQQACSGRSQLVPLAGEAGIGKTRLAGEFAQELHGQGALVLYGRCDEEPLAPYQPFLQALRELVHASPEAHVRALPQALAGELTRLLPELRDRFGELPEPLAGDPEGERYRLFEAVTAFLVAASGMRPVALLLEDLHWADRSSVLLLKHMVRNASDARLLVVATHREEEVVREHPLAQALADLHRDHELERIVLGGLDREEVAELITAIDGDEPDPEHVRSLHERSDGHPFFLVELLRHGEESAGEVVPEGVRDLVRRRLDRLAQPARMALPLAAVIGAAFTWDVLEGLAELPADDLQDALDEALAAMLIEEDPAAFGRYWFSHALVRETLYQDLSATRRARLHHRVGDVLEAVHGPDSLEALPALAHHFLAARQAGDLDRGIAYSLRAGARAAEQLAFEEAAGHYERALDALELLERPPDLERCRLLLALGHAHWSAGEVERSREDFTRAAGLAEALGAPEELAQAALGFGGQYPTFAVGISDPPLTSLLERALRALGDDESALRATVMARLAVLLAYTPERNRAQALAHEAIELARGAGDKRALGEVLLSAHWGVGGPDNLEERFAITRELLQLGREVGDSRLESEGHGWGMSDLFELGDRAGANREKEEFERVVEALRRPFPRWAVIHHRAMHALVDGRFADAERLAVEALELGQETQNPNAVMQFGAQLFELRYEQGRLEEILESLERFAEEYPAFPGWRCAVAWACAQTGREAQARRLLAELARDRCAVLPRDLIWLTGVALLARTAARLGDREHAQVLYELLLPYGHRCLVAAPGAYCSGSLLRELGILAATLERFDDAERHLRHALDVNISMRAPALVAQTRFDLASMLVARARPGDREAALELVDQIRPAAREMAMTRLLDELTRLEPRLQAAAGVR